MTSLLSEPEDWPYYPGMVQNAPTKYNPLLSGFKYIDMQPLLDTVSKLTGSEALSAAFLGRGFFNVIYEIKIRTGPPLVARIQYNYKTDSASTTWTQQKMSRETAVLALLQRVSPQVPVPRVLACELSFDNLVGAPFTIMSRLYGEDQWMAWPKLTASEKITFIKSLAAVTVGIWNVRLPSIGSLEMLTPEGLPVVASVLPYTDLMPCQLCTTIEQYITQQLDYAFAQPHDQTLYEFSLQGLFDRVRTLADSVIPRDDPAMLVPVLVHLDMNNRNIMVKDATVSGVLDWERHLSLPACLGATYPPILRYDAIYDPKYGIKGRLMPTKECWPAEPEANMLKIAFREAVGKLSVDFLRALDKGEILRQLLELVSYSTEDTTGMKILFTWEKEMTEKRMSLN